MSYSNIKITQADINNNNVRSASDILIGNADDNKAVFDKLPEFIAGKHNDLVDALDEVSEHAQDDTEEIDRLSAEKVNVPKNGTDLDYGEVGQMLTTKGNGETQWEDAGQPTDEQAQNAINNWLDRHPEATTTVQDGSLTEPKFADSLKYKTFNDYVIPQMFGAKGDGITNDTLAFTEALASNKGVTIPSANYKLSNYIFSDESHVIADNGVYTDKPVIVSKTISDAPMSIVERKSIPLADLGITWGSGLAYNSDTGKLLFCGYDDNKVVQVDLATLTVEASATVAGLGHGNDAAYNPTTKKYYCCTMANNGEIKVINTNLTVDSTIIISNMNYAPSQIAYDADKDIYYIGNSQYTHVVDSDFNVIKLLSTHANNEVFENSYENIKQRETQGSTVVDGQFLCGVWLCGENVGADHGRSYARLVSFNYKTGGIKAFYDFPLPILAEEFEAVEYIDGKLYLFSSRFGQVHIFIVYPNKLYLSNDNPQYPKYIDATRTDNPYCTDEDVKRLRTFTNGNIGVLKFSLNLSTSMPANTRNITIGNLNVHSYDEMFAVVPAQNNSGNLLVDIKTTGDVVISNVNSVTLSGFFRTSIPFIVT